VGSNSTLSASLRQGSGWQALLNQSFDWAAIRIGFLDF
jgi:hypothetical protein